MMSPIASYLAEFRPYGAESGALPMPPPSLDDPPVDPALVVAARIDEARQAGADAAREKAAVDLSAEKAALAAAHEHGLASARAAWAEGEGAVLARKFADALQSLEERIAETVAGVLGPLLPTAARLGAIESLRESVMTLIENGGGGSIAVSGPADLVASLQRTFGDRGGITFAAGSDPEVTIRSGDTQIRSALGAWADRLAQHLGAAHER